MSKQLVSEIFQILFGILLASIGLKMFLLPNGFLDGGVTGIAILLSKVLGWDISIIILLVNVPFLLLAWRSLPKTIFFKSVIAIIVLAIVIHFENFKVITQDKLLIAIFGGLLLGAGIGITVKNGAVLDGSEILGVFINERLGISIGKIIFLFNTVLFAVTALIISVETAMYSILTFLVTAKIIDLMIQGFEDYVGLMIVSQQSARINQLLQENIGSGTTIYKGSGGFSKNPDATTTDKQIIHTVINRIDIRRTYNLIDSVDPNVFVIEFDVNNVKGGIHTQFKAVEHLKKMIPISRKKTPAT